MKNTLLIVGIVFGLLALFAGGFAVGFGWAAGRSSELDDELKRAQIETYRMGQQAFRAVVEPQFAKASDDTRASSTMTNLRTIRSQLVLYRAQHNEAWPTDFARQMTEFTDEDGKTNATQSARFRFGPYMLRVPANPYTGVATVTTVQNPAMRYRAAADLVHGWWYNSATGEFPCHLPDSVLAPDGTQINKL